MDQMHEVLRYHHYGLRTEEAYTKWVRWFIIEYSGTRHPREMGKTEIEASLLIWLRSAMLLLLPKIRH